MQISFPEQVGLRAGNDVGLIVQQRAFKRWKTSREKFREQVSPLG
jgi:hypothetical protein